MENNNGNKFSEILIVLFVVFFAVGAVIAYYIKTSEQRVSNVQIESTNIDGSNDKEKQVIDDVNKDIEDDNEDNDDNDKDFIKEKIDKDILENNNKLKKVQEFLSYKYDEGFTKISCPGDYDDDCNISKTVNVNDKTIKISITKPSNIIITVGNDTHGPIIPDYLYYKVIKGSDNKEYLIVAYNAGPGVTNVFIYNDEGREIFDFSSFGSDGVDCQISIENEKFFTVVDDVIYFYKFIKNTYKSGNVDVELFEISIDNSIVKTDSTRIIKKGRVVECSY